LPVFPDTLKYAIIKPLFKSGDINNTANYRNISLLTAFFKLFEIAIFRRVSQHFQVYNTLIPEQYGFRRALSTFAATWLVFFKHGTIKHTLEEFSVIYL